MKKTIFYLLFCFVLSGSLMGQKLNDFQYVKVPEKYEFLKEENQYQLNALTAFLFEKYGFEVLYGKDRSQNIDPCKVLEANVHSDSGLFRTRLYVTLQNCKGETVFTSETGVSREKDFKDSYHEALRKAFTSIEQLEHPHRLSSTSDVSQKEDNGLPKKVIIDPVASVEEIDELSEADKPSLENASQLKEQDTLKFTNAGSVYLLKKAAGGFELFKADGTEKMATLIKSTGGENYVYASKRVSGNAFFDDEDNLVVEYLDPDSGQLISIKYLFLPQ